MPVVDTHKQNDSTDEQPERMDRVTMIDKVNRYLGSSIDWQPMAQSGSTNRLFCANHAGQKLVLRLNANEQQAFGVIREREAMVLKAVQPYGWAPQIIHNAWQQGWCLMFDHGASLQGESNPGYEPIDFLRQTLLDAVSEWQAIVGGSCIDYQALFESYRVALPASAETFRELLGCLQIAFQKLPEVPLCLTHHDLHRGNLCLDGDALVVLDWEYAAIGNPWFDAASLCQQFAIENDVIAALPAWRSLDREQFLIGMALAVWLGKALDCLWYAVRTTNDEMFREKAIDRDEEMSEKTAQELERNGLKEAGKLLLEYPQLDI